jgi:hypothetical protein
MTTNLDLIRRTLDALNMATDAGDRGLLYAQLDSLRSGCNHERTTMVRENVILMVIGVGSQLCDMLECRDCLVGLTRPHQPVI